MTALATAFIKIRPSADGFRQETEKKVSADLDKVGTTAGQSMGRSLAKSLGAALKDAGSGIGKTVADEFAKGFNDRVKDQTKDAPVGPDRSRTRRQGEQSAGSFADGFRKQLEQASRALPPLTVGVAKDAAEQQIRDLQTKLRDLSGKTIGIDLDAGAAIAQVRGLENELRVLAATTPNIQVRADAAAALARLSQVTAEADKLDRKHVDVNVDVDTDRASRTMSSFGVGLADKLGSALSGVSSLASTFFQSLSEGAVKAGGQITTSVLSAAAGETAMTAATGGLNLALGALVLALLAGAGAVVALTVGFVALAPIVLAAGGILGGFTTLLAGTGAAVGVFVLGLRGLGDTFTAMGAAQDDAAKSSASYASAQNAVRNASDQVRSALAAESNTRANVADAARRAGQQITDALQRVKDAQQTLTDAERDALQVRKDLTRAQTEAKQNLEDLASQVKSNALDQRQAVLDVTDAQKALQKVLKDPKATAEQRAQAQLTYDRQVQQLDDLRVRGRRLAAEQADANKKGVNGSDQVVAARQRITAADRKVIDSQRGVAQAQAAAADARRAQQTQERQGAYQLAQAHQAVVAAQRALTQASTQAGVAGGSALQKLNQEMAKLSPNARDLVKTLFGLKGPFDELRKFVQDRLLEGVAGQVRDLASKWLPPLHSMLGGLADRFNAFGDSLFKAFGNKDFIANMRAAVGGFGDMIGRIGQSMPGFLDAFGRISRASVPVLQYIGDLIGGIFDKFSKWIKSADQTGALDSFMKDAAATLRQIFDIGGLVLGIIGKVVQIFYPQSKVASAGFLGGVEQVLKNILGWLSDPKNQQKVREWVAAIAGFVTTVVTEWIPAAERWTTRISGWVTTVEGWINTVRAFATGLIGSFRSAYDQISTVVVGLQVAVGTRIQAIIGFLRSLRDFVSVALVAGFRAFTTIAGTVLGTFTAGVRAVWDSIRTGSLDPLRTFITQTLPNAFRTGVSAITTAWSKVQEAARVPVAFVVNSVINPFLHGFNAISHVFNGPQFQDIKLATGGMVPRTVPGYAQGGRIAGLPSSVDNRLAPATIPGVGAVKLAGGEFVVNARDTAKALPILEWINKGMQGGPGQVADRIGRPLTDMPGDGSEGWAFKDGGLVGWVKSVTGTAKSAINNVWDSVSDPTKLIKAPFEAALKLIPGGGPIKDFLVSAANKVLSGALDWISGAGGGVGGGGVAGGDVGRVQAFIRAQAGKPYVWASAGPGGYDCSGLVSAAFNLLHGKSPYSHTFSTEGLPGSYFKVGARGPLMAGWSHPGQSPASNSTGHMAGQIGTLPFESRGSRGVVVGAAARRITDFATTGAARAKGGIVTAKALGMPVMDNGGWLMPGWNPPIYNGTGRPEPVTPAPTMDRVVDRLDQLITAITDVAPAVAAALERPTRKAIQLGRGTTGVTVRRAGA